MDISLLICKKGLCVRRLVTQGYLSFQLACAAVHHKASTTIACFEKTSIHIMKLGTAIYLFIYLLKEEAMVETVNEAWIAHPLNAKEKFIHVNGMARINLAITRSIELLSFDTEEKRIGRLKR